MRLRVEVEWQGQPWRRRIKVQKLAMVDAAFGILLAIIYLVKLAFPTMEPEFPGLTSAEQLNNSMALVFLILANLAQTLHASRLCYVVSLEECQGRDPTSCFEAAKTWYDFTQFSYLFITVKWVITLSYVIKVAPAPWVLTLLGVTTPEIIFKFWMLLSIYGFMKDLKQSLKYLPKFRFIPVRADGSDVVMGGGVDVDVGDKFQVDVVDVNANTKLLV